MWDPSTLSGSASLSLNNTRLNIPTNSTSNNCQCNRPKSSGKWYTEVRPIAFQNGSFSIIGITGIYWYRYSSSVLIINGTSSRPAYSSVYALGTVIGMAFDADNRTLQFFKNGVGQAVINLASYPGVGTANRVLVGSATQAGGAQGVFDLLNESTLAYAPPAGYQPW